MPGFVPVAGPFPDIARHLVEAVAVRSMGVDRSGALIAIARIIAPADKPVSLGHSRCLSVGREEPPRR